MLPESDKPKALTAKDYSYTCYRRLLGLMLELSLPVIDPSESSYLFKVPMYREQIKAVLLLIPSDILKPSGESQTSLNIIADYFGLKEKPLTLREISIKYNMQASIANGRIIRSIFAISKHLNQQKGKPGIKFNRKKWESRGR